MVNILVFEIGKVRFGIETMYVKTVIKRPDWWINTEHFPNSTGGIVAYNGQKMVVLNFSDRKLNKAFWEDFIVVSFKNSEYVLPTEETIDIFQISEKDIAPIPLYAERNLSKNLFKGVFPVDDKLILILDVSKFLN
jgi:chemotaxis signal transduction protein